MRVKKGDVVDYHGLDTIAIGVVVGSDPHNHGSEAYVYLDTIPVLHVPVYALSPHIDHTESDTVPIHIVEPQ